MNASHRPADGLSRRQFVQHCGIGAAVLAWRPVWAADRNAATRTLAAGPASQVLELKDGWRFGGHFEPAHATADFNDGSWPAVTVPHCVAGLSWQRWDARSWHDVWSYRCHFTLPPDWKGLRVFACFDAVMAEAGVSINGQALSPHLGGYLPFRREITAGLKSGDNVLSLAVDGRPRNTPPGSPDGKARVDYLVPAGIIRGVRLAAVPNAYLADVFAKPVDVMRSGRRVEVTCQIDGAVAAGPAAVDVELRDGGRVIARARQSVNLAAGATSVAVSLTQLGEITLWDVDAPKLYRVVATLSVAGQPVHDHAVRIGFREARFTVDGFFLNGRRLRLFGLNRHEIYPYVGAAMPARVMRRDAEILRRDFNCNIVRCSHYPQSAAFLDACDEFGLMVWEEVPGWQYLGDAEWKKQLEENVREMIVRDRNRPSVVIWGTRVNESPNDVALYERTRDIAKSLDDSRPTSGSLTPDSRRHWERDWHEEVFAFDDYHAAPDGSVGIDPPLPGVPYMNAEAVGQFNYTARNGFGVTYRRDRSLAVLQQQALRHAQAHARAAAMPRHCGVIAWCAFDYASNFNRENAVKYPGVADVFRLPKLGASFYLAQGDPKTRPVIEPNFYWDFGAQSPRGPGKQAAIFSNCERLEVFVGGKPHATLRPDVANFGGVPHPPFFVDLDLDGAGNPELRIDGYVADRKVVSRSFSADAAKDRLDVSVDDPQLVADGSDATRLQFKVADAFGAPRCFAKGTVSFEVSGPATLVGDNPFSLDEAGGVAAVWVRAGTQPGRITVTATHSSLGKKTVTIESRTA